MFVQCITAKVTDEAGFRKQHEKWQREVAPGAIGYLGSTGGLTEDGRLFLAARFETAEAAQQNGVRQEQDAWWKETEGYLSDVVFEDSSDVQPYLGGGSDDSGFVQVMRYRLKDIGAAREIWAEMDKLPNERPDLMGALTVTHDGGSVTDILYFTNEKEARENEGKTPSPEAAEVMGRWGELIDGDIEYLDLKEPLLHSK
jgi:hypothetical protein